MRKSNFTHFSAKTITKMVNDNELRVDNPVQRAFVWDIPRRSDFIDSILGGWLIPGIHVEKRNEGKTKSRDIYDVLDGQQRTLSIATFCNDEWALTGLNPIVIDDVEYDLEGKTFSELPEKLQDIINEYMLPVFWTDEMTQEEKTTQFRKLNNGKPLSTNDQNVAHCGDLTTVAELGKHEAFEKILTPAGKKGKRHVSYIMKTYMILHETMGEFSFESKVFRPYCASVKFSFEDKEEILKILDYVNGILTYATSLKGKANKDALAKFKKDTHLVSLVPYIKDAISKGYRPAQFWDFASNFLNISDREYSRASNSDTSKTAAIVKRDAVLGKAWNAYVNRNEPTPEVDVKVVEVAKDNEEPVVEETAVEEVA